jgi:hypothetical protein
MTHQNSCVYRTATSLDRGLSLIAAFPYCLFGGGSEPLNLDQATIPPYSAKLRGMTDDLDTLHARLDKLAALVELAQLNQAKDHARIERSIQLVCCALQEMARFWRQTGTQTCQSEAAEIMALGRRIVEDARRAGLRIVDNNNWE